MIKEIPTKVLSGIEQALVLIIAALTVFAAGDELRHIITSGRTQLADLLLLFIYAEVITMVSIFYSSREIRAIYPIFIAITAMARLLLLQSKDMSPQNLLYEAAAILLLAMAVAIIRWSGRYIDT